MSGLVNICILVSSLLRALCDDAVPLLATANSEKAAASTTATVEMDIMPSGPRLCLETFAACQNNELIVALSSR